MLKKILCAFLALMLLFSLSCSTLAEGVAAPLVGAVRTLLFETYNATLTGKAEFSLNGERFKTAEILYKQAGENSHWQLDLSTPRLYRGDQKTGFTIIANGQKIFVMERFYPGTYSEGTDQPNDTLIRQSTRADLLFSLLLSVADQAEALLPEGAVSVAESGSGREIRLVLSEETVPPVMNTSLNLLADFILRRFMGINYDSVRESNQVLLENCNTVTRGILYTTDSFVLGDTSVTVTEDSAGRITGASGTVTALLNSEELSRAPLEISFDLAVSDYGLTAVRPFVPEDFGVVPRGDALPVKEVDPALAEKLETRAKELLTAAGYEDSSIPQTVNLREEDGFYLVNFLGDSYEDTVTVGLNEDGDLLTLNDAADQYVMSSPREPKEDSLAPETANAIRAYMKDAFPAVAENVQEYMLGLEYEENGVTWQFVYGLDEHQANTGVFLIVRTAPALRITHYTCMNR